MHGDTVTEVLFVSGGLTARGGLPRGPRAYALAATAVLAAAAALVWWVRPASGLGYAPRALAKDTALTRTGVLSTELLDALHISGSRAAEALPAAGPCPQDPGPFYRAIHQWSLYGVGADRLEAGFQRLLGALPTLHWKITARGTPKGYRPGPDAVSLTAEHTGDHFALRADLLPHAGAGGTPAIRVLVTSACYRAPAGPRHHTPGS